MNEGQMLVETAVRGKQVQDFLNSDIGQYLQDRITQERANAIDGFARCDATNVQEVMKWQNQMRNADSMIDWLSRIIQDGLNALNILDSQE